MKVVVYGYTGMVPSQIVGSFGGTKVLTLVFTGVSHDRECESWCFTEVFM